MDRKVDKPNGGMPLTPVQDSTKAASSELSEPQIGTGILRSQPVDWIKLIKVVIRPECGPIRCEVSENLFRETELR